MDLDGRVALVTGGSRGIGRGICLALAGSGADVVVNYHEQAGAAREVVEAIEELGRHGLALQADVAVEADVDRMIEAALDRFGTMDILVNNAGICPFHDFLDMPVKLWDRVHAVNLRGTFLCSQAAARIMVDRGIKGRIISISSISALVGGAQQCHYSPTKAGQESFMRSLAIVLGTYGITCNSVAPGTIETDINVEDLSDPEKRASMESRTPVGRLGAPDDIGPPVAFLASDEAAYITGASLLVDGGLFVNLQ